MRTEEQAVWDQFDKVFTQADMVWEEADKFWAKARTIYRGYGGSETSFNRVYKDMSKGSHTLRFKAKTIGERWRLCCRFLTMGLRVMRYGQTEFKFKAQ